MPKLTVAIQPTDPSHLAAARMFGELALTLRDRQRNLPTATDPEVLHDFRTTLRRTRALLRNFRGVIRGTVRERFQHELRSIQRATGLARDLDVFQDELPMLWMRLPRDSAPQLARVTDLVSMWRMEVWADLLDFLERHATQSTLNDWNDLVSGLESANHHALGKHARAPVARYARKQLGRAAQTYFENDAVMVVSTTPRDLHRLRIRGKRLRYWVEAFRPLFPTATVHPLLGTLKRLQDRLGHYNDVVTQIDLLEYLSKRLDSSHNSPANAEQGLPVDHASANARPDPPDAHVPAQPMTGQDRAACSAAVRQLLDIQRSTLSNEWARALDGAALLRKPETIHRIRRLIHTGPGQPSDSHQA